MNIYIPFTPRFFSLNLKLFELTKSRPELFKHKTNVVSTYGSFANCIWNGGRLLEDDGVTTEEKISAIISLYNSLGIKFRLTFTNNFVQEKHLKDKYANMILDIAAESGINEILINYNSVLEEYIKNKHPNKFEFISSVTRCERNIDNINKLCKKYKLTVIDYRDNRSNDFLNAITDKSKAEIMLNDNCNFYCESRLEHHLDQQIRILTNGNMEEAYKLGYKGIGCMYEHPVFMTGSVEEYASNDITGYITASRTEEIINMGFDNFKFVGRDYDAIPLAKQYSYYLIKDEYQDEVTDLLLKTAYSEVIEQLENYFID